MLSVVRFLVQYAILIFSFHSRNQILVSCLGCKRSQVQILSRRPVYLLEIINNSICFNVCKSLQENATKLSKSTAFAWVCGTVFGTSHSEPFHGHARPLSQSIFQNSIKTSIARQSGDL